MALKEEKVLGITWPDVTPKGIYNIIHTYFEYFISIYLHICSFTDFEENHKDFRFPEVSSLVTCLFDYHLA